MMETIRNPYALAILVYLLAMQKRGKISRKNDLMIHFNINAFVASDSVNYLLEHGYLSVERHKNSDHNTYHAFDIPQKLYPVKEL